MNNELLSEATQLFKTPDQWAAFNELANRKAQITNYWWKKLKTEVQSRELQSGNPDWNFYAWDNWDMMWYAKGAPNNTYSVHYWGRRLRVTGYGGLNQKKIKELLLDKKFNIIRQAFEQISGYSNDDFAYEDGNFNFGSSQDGNFASHEELAWYAGNRTEEYADQIIRKVRRFQTPEILELFREINERCIVK